MKMRERRRRQFTRAPWAVDRTAGGSWMDRKGPHGAVPTFPRQMVMLFHSDGSQSVYDMSGRKPRLMAGQPA